MRRGKKYFPERRTSTKMGLYAELLKCQIIHQIHRRKRRPNCVRAILRTLDFTFQDDGQPETPRVDLTLYFSRYNKAVCSEPNTLNQ